MSEPYLYSRTPNGAEFRLPPESARRFVRFGSATAGLVLGICAAIFAGGIATGAGASDAGVVAWAAGLGALGGALAALAAHRHFAPGAVAVLAVGADGRVKFGGRELVAPGKAVQVHVREIVAGEDTPAFAVMLALRDGRRKQLPVPGLGVWGRNRGFLDLETAVRFAELVADPLGVRVEADLKG